ncbi:uncharacterized protein LOC106055834 [Biomphalaria glabrata]|uniref:Uncharacterized protein LOC106055834 n=1 Tax=Biomphalaria glabrata TaxID=6526 RepID=A0A9W3AP53_BIOGL|nr:uncharacterized protein LOC106055834 [Biomphalaria glabrata]XP_055889015.1 uncharacterized protein LOC106055834 [Biomphalaria glabrata]XP_055889016.1 uncharacterized protein LOC106055834 [Biomphalaria glabrata]XP_055889018.1 uncharacterized protein LOC106055834 [Biomphalaria glabrata]XP_055889019.1 uncharacterized protein LOC106055834 [Biomphalaria glabrata]XP_055889020.1 uncharacterized protein LOC106055834 [Biomphalaria glabrata]XP_055889021.1 uncharacterized protein LOC106055834 [Biomph
MWTCLGLSVYTLSVFIVCTTHVGGTEILQKCLNDFEPFDFGYIFICINGNLTDKKVQNLTCKAGEHLYIEDFVLYLPRKEDGKCPPPDGFNYKHFVNASCLNREYKELSKKIVSVLMTSHEDIIGVQSLLNTIVNGLFLLTALFQCQRENVNSIDICEDNKIDGLSKGFMKLNTESLRAMTLRPSSCTCSVVSSEKNITLSAVDVRLAKTQIFKSYQENNSRGSDIFENDSLLWKIDGKKVITSRFTKFNLSVGNKFNFSQSLWIELEGSGTNTMNITCSPLFNNESDRADVSHESNSTGLAIEIIVGLAIGGFVTLVVLIILMVLVVSRRRNRTEQDSLTKRAPSTSFSEIKEAIYAEPDTPVAETKTPLVSSNYMELEKNNIYAEPGPANNNFKLGDLTSQSCTDEESDNLVPNIYNHLGEQPVPPQSHIYDTTGSHDYSTTFDRKNKPKVIHNIYDR